MKTGEALDKLWQGVGVGLNVESGVVREGVR